MQAGKLLSDPTGGVNHTAQKQSAGGPEYSRDRPLESCRFAWF